ncbi:hypothetical protein J6590_041063 [Homalodisca vitripennis]|nr:hypothetical protein J6590_041063 [Homalodisca vitripennis]
MNAFLLTVVVINLCTELRLYQEIARRRFGTTNSETPEGSVVRSDAVESAIPGFDGSPRDKGVVNASLESKTGQQRTCEDPLPTIDGNYIPRCDKVKDLGVFFNVSLSPDDHSNVVCSLTIRLLGFLCCGVVVVRLPTP